VEVAATAGNGRLLAGFDAAGDLKTLCAPHLDHPQHVQDSRFGVAPIGPGALVQWLRGPRWRHQQDYLSGTNTLRTRSTQATAAIELDRRVTAVGDALLQGVRLQSRRPVTVHWEISLQLGGQPLGNALIYYPEQDALLTYHREHALALAAIPAASQVHGRARGAGAGLFSGPGGERFAVVGETTAEIRLTLQPGETILLLLVLGRPDDALAGLAELRGRYAAGKGWPQELAESSAPTPHAATEAGEAAVRSQLTIAQFCDRSGAIVAGPPIDARFRRSGGYAYCWPRDGAFVAHALLRTGRPEAARAFFEWVLPLQPADGLWKQRYFADGELAPSWALHQLDETGTVLWALDQYLAERFDGGLQSRGLEAATLAFRGVTRLAAETGWPPVTENLWEDQQGAHAYTLAALLAGAQSWHQRARALADRPAIAVLGHAEERLQQALADWPVENQTGALARALVGGRGTAGLHPDFTPDASLLGLSVPFAVLKPRDLRLERTVQVIERALTTPSGRVRRYRGDRYMGGNPWPLCGLWLAWHHLRAERRDAGLRLYRRALGDRTPSGLFPEQVNARTGKARWVVPLPWAHAWFLLMTGTLKPAGPSGRAG
jgi:hypothetical protein